MKPVSILLITLFAFAACEKENNDNNNIVTDFDGNDYQTVTIGAQIWMKENLKVTHYADGTPIQSITGNSNWEALTVTSKAYCWYDDDSATNAPIYGALYRWAAAMNGASSSTSTPSGIQGVCPAGWHLPSEAEWTELTDYIGGESVAGSKLKEAGTAHWNSPNIDATNETGYTALPGGDRISDGTFTDIGDIGYWWSATETNADYAWSQVMLHNDGGIFTFDGSKELGFSVRCVQD
ncbi:MAG: fibrobacter succinogenes major paralogous domain-containing protein [Bacteroidales bacterium]|nr:fibrobacter succinogenes major paralogous domain-containing protein [Bacteroidales bacterium]